jgi:NAD(P)H-nitrite reductase large subunit
MRRLVVVGNGMAGIRAIEEVLARTGADMSEITATSRTATTTGSCCRIPCRQR